MDDEIAIRKVATKILEVFGYRVVSASDGTEALATFMQNRSDIAAIVTDMLMPGMDGPTFVKVVRRIEPGIRIIGISGVGEGTTTDIIESLALSALLVKPFTGASLAFELHTVLQAPPGTKVSRSASPWRGVSRAPGGLGPEAPQRTRRPLNPSPAAAGEPAGPGAGVSGPAGEKNPMKRTEGHKTESAPQKTAGPCGRRARRSLDSLVATSDLLNICSRAQPAACRTDEPVRTGVSAAKPPAAKGRRPAGNLAKAKEQFLLRTLMENIPEHVYFKDRDSRFIAVSEAMARQHGMELRRHGGEIRFRPVLRRARPAGVRG